ncbi:MAG: ankyrin repeat domain-containing protein [Candidatus Micrarchaeota archaeon]|nr:ankyrin repeat domain-containing protein [Candidatus Micrarchaeota archaeon]
MENYKKRENNPNLKRINFKGKYPLNDYENKNVSTEKEQIVKILFEAVRESNMELLNKILESGYDVNTRDPTNLNSTLLHEAARKGDLNMYLYLITSGADINAKDDLGRTARDIAIEEDQIQIIKYPENLLLKYYLKAKEEKKR